MLYLVLFGMLGILGGAHFYLAHRVWRLIHRFAPRFPLFISVIFFAMLMLLMALSFIKPFSGRLQQVFSVAGAAWMGCLVYLLLFFLLADLLALILHLPHFAAGSAALVLALSVCLYGFVHAQQVKTVSYDVTLSPAPANEMTVVLISDVHLGAVGSEGRLEQIVSRINALSPDLVCIAGDLFDTTFTSIRDPERAILTLRQIKATHGVYACLGNHDAGKTLPQMEDFLERAGILLLKDEFAVIDGKFILAGRLDSSPIGGTGNLRRGALADILRSADPSLPVVVMDHNPAGIDTYRGDTALVLSGHTHKGQLFPGSLFTHAMYTVDYGYYQTENGTQIIVTSGAGTWGPPMRIGTDCEVVQIRLKY